MGETNCELNNDPTSNVKINELQEAGRYIKLRRERLVKSGWGFMSKQRIFPVKNKGRRKIDFPLTK